MTTMKTRSNHRARADAGTPPRRRTAFGVLVSTAVLATTTLLASCGDGDHKGGQCEPCGSGCDSGLTCKLFGNSTVLTQLCASPNTTSCPGV
jgi:hypothetical protein